MKDYFKKKNFRKVCFLAGLLLFMSNIAFAQTVTVTGHIYDVSDKYPLAGTTVIVQGTKNVVVSDMEGNFTLTAPSNATLEFRYLGYEVLVEPLNGRTKLDIGLRIAENTLDEVVAIGYGSAKKRDLTGAVGSIKLEDSPRALLPNTNAFDALKGQIPGFDVGTATGAGGNPGITIRGQNTLNTQSGAQNPLVVVDGVIFLGSLNEINPSDISSIDVLKDASSSAVYGSQASNGIILITTKRGKTEKPVINLSASTGFQTYTTKADMLGPEDFLQMRRDLRTMNGASPADLELKNLLTSYEYSAYEQNSVYDWFDEATRVAPLQDYNLSVSGAGDRVNYYVSGQFLNQTGVLVGDQFKRINLTSKIESKLTDWLKVGVTLSVTSKNNDGKEADLRNATNSTPYSFKTVQFPDFLGQMERSPQGQVTTINPLWQTQEYNKDRNQNYRSIFMARIDVPWVKGLSYTFNYSLNRWEGHQERFYDERYYMNTLDINDLRDQTKYLVNANGYKEHVTRTDWYVNNIINYNHTFAKKHAVDLTLMSERSEVVQTSSKLSARDFSEIGTTALGVDALELGNSANRGVESGKFREARLAYLARVNYVYDKKYLITASIRQDGYSGYSPGYQYGTFSSLAGAWTISEESFFESLKSTIDFLKVRASYGQNGNSNVDPYTSFPSMSSSLYLFGNTPAKTQFVNKLVNKAFQWESTGAFNFGLDFGILKQRLSGSVNYYSSITNDLLINRAIPIMNGFANVMSNIGQLENKGFEFQLNSVNIKNHDFSWNSTLNFWLNRNKLVSYGGLDMNGDGKEDDNIANNWFIGKSLGANYTYIFDGIIQNDDAEYMAIYGGNPGDVKFKDLNGDGKIDATNDRTVVGYEKPNFTMNLSNTLNYKNFQLYFALHWLSGGGNNNYGLANNMYAYLPSTFGGGGSSNWLDKPYWMPNRPSNEIPRPNYSNPLGYQFPHNYDFLRLQDVSLSYTFDKKWLSKTPLEDLRLNISGKNLLTFTGWEGQDPESKTQFASTSFPVMKSIVFSLDVKF